MRLCNVLLLLFLSLPVSVFAAPERITPLAHGLLDGVGLACDEQGGCFVSLCRRGEVVRVAANGKVAVVARGIKFPTGIVRADDGAVYCASAGENSIWALSVSAQNSPDSGDTGGPGGDVVHGASHVRLLRHGGAPSVLHLDSDGGILLVRGREGAVVRLTPGGGSRVLLNGLHSPLAVVPWNGGLAVLCRKSTWEHDLLFFDNGRKTADVLSGMPERPGPGLGVYGRWLLVPDYGKGGVTAISDNGEVRRVAGSIAHPVAVRADGKGRLFVLSSATGTLHVVENW
ncbi:MAG: hypothetical protein ACNI3A_07495 [Desulfovibrio sp.]|uniref:hypothetical protein n=1 Tax=Desulfovibrio sp. 7SRBS1 TaxID=3378064 RepID=UPI003B3D5B8B